MILGLKLVTSHEFVLNIFLRPNNLFLDPTFNLNLHDQFYIKLQLPFKYMWARSGPSVVVQGLFCAIEGEACGNDCLVNNLGFEPETLPRFHGDSNLRLLVCQVKILFHWARPCWQLSCQPILIGLVGRKEKMKCSIQF